MNRPTLRLGAHMSIAGGMPKAVERAKAVDATALQVFVKSSNQWRARPFAEGEAEAYRAAAVEAGLDRHTAAHASYLVNLASPDDALWQKSIAAFAEEAARCDTLGIPFLVVHPGSHVGSGEAAGLDRLADALDRVHEKGPEVTVCLEITAGQGSNLGARLEQFARVIERAACGGRLGVCFDSCHALAAGIEFRDRDSFDEAFREFDRVIGLDRLRVFHLNDSKGGLGSRLDRHEHIGRGEVGLEAFRLILNDPRFAGLPMVLETPKGEDLAEDRENLAVLRAMVGR